jgi:rhodanese-related sulfurtransferase
MKPERLGQHFETARSDVAVAEIFFGKTTAPEVLIDIRDDREWSAGHVPGALHVPARVLASWLAESSFCRSTRYVLYCFDGVKSGEWAAELAQHGRADVRALAGGYLAWLDAGAPEFPGAIHGEFGN